jgi:hypothetical protein
MTGNADDLGLAGKIGEEVRGEVFIDTNTHHVLSVDNARLWRGFSILACGRGDDA